MKLVGSLTENIIRQELKLSEINIRKDNQIYTFLNTYYHPISTLYILGLTPEQGEDIYTLIINGEKILNLEYSKVDYTFSNIEVISLDEYEKTKKGKMSRLKLAIALDLARYCNDF